MNATRAAAASTTTVGASSSIIGSAGEKRRFLLAWPTIPVMVKGSDTRALDAIKHLTKRGFAVDLVFWRDHADEIIDESYDDSHDQTRVMDAGAKRIIGPYNTKTTKEEFQSQLKHYDFFVYWLWPDMDYLDPLKKIDASVKHRSAATKTIAVLDDRGIAARFLVEKASTNPDYSVEAL